MNHLQIPLTEYIENLLESQRKSFEILLCIFRQRIDNDIPSFLVLDEYLDKDIPVVRDKIYKNLLILCMHSDLQLQVIVITHSKSTCLNCSDKAIVLHNGKVFDSGEPKKVTVPKQMLWLP
mmetsp:Transcript_15319/g.20993  ORF Transcript_15319/g.20993 Transcript_15319/m.20993 type:complete len:121 (+) Transcript_15319:474-836(+)